MRLTARIYLIFKTLYNYEKEIVLEDEENNAADIFRRETVGILGNAVNELCQKEEITADELANSDASITNQKKMNSKFIIGYFLIKNQDGKAKRVNDFLQVLKLVEDEIFGEALYDVNYRRNVKQRKEKSLPKNDDVEKLLSECKKVMSAIDVFNFFQISLLQ